MYLLISGFHLNTEPKVLLEKKKQKMSFEATFPKLWSTTGCPGEPWIYKINLRIYKVVNILISSLFQALFRLES